MKLSMRVSIGLMAILFASQAHAFTFFNLASADSKLIGISGNQTLTVGGPAITEPNTTSLIDFFPFSDHSDSLLVGDSTNPTRFNQTYSFTYEITNGVPVQSVGIVLQGVLGGSGFISFVEDVFAVDGIGNETLVGSIGNGLRATGTTNNVGSLTFNGPSYTYTQNVVLSQAVTKYKIKKSFFLAVDPTGFLPTRDYAGIALIEQAHLVPEPLTLGALALGLAGMARIKRRRK